MKDVAEIFDRLYENVEFAFMPQLDYPCLGVFEKPSADHLHEFTKQTRALFKSYGIIPYYFVYLVGSLLWLENDVQRYVLNLHPEGNYQIYDSLTERWQIEYRWRNYILDQQSRSTASGWLAVAGRLLAESSDALCSAEVSATRAHLLEAAGEFRDAIDHASAAFEKWSGFAENITNWDELESVRALLRVIAGPDDDLDLDDQRMQFEWMADRLSPRVLASAKAVIRLCAPLGNPRPERCRLRTFRARSTNSLKILSWVLS